MTGGQAGLLRQVYRVAAGSGRGMSLSLLREQFPFHAQYSPLFFGGDKSL